MGAYEYKPQTKENPAGQTTNFIPNPLPVPVRKEHVTMDYDHEVPIEAMRYDIENPARDYYDI